MVARWSVLPRFFACCGERQHGQPHVCWLVGCLLLEVCSSRWSSSSMFFVRVHLPGELQLTTTPQGFPAGATLCPHSALSWVTFLKVSTAMFQPWCSVNWGLMFTCGSGASMCSEMGPQPGASCSSPRPLSPRWRQGCVHCSVPALAFKPCSSNGPNLILRSQCLPWCVYAPGGSLGSSRHFATHAFIACSGQT